MKRVIALWGAGSTGKSCTLKIVHAYLSKKAESSIHEINKSGADLRDIFIINGFKVGIETQGDPGSRLSNSLDLFKENDCKIIICPTRTRGETTNIVKRLSPPYYISWRGQSSVSEEALEKESNSSMAKLIINEFMAAINA